MTVYAADFGPGATAATPGLTQYDAAGAVTVARTTTGIVHIAAGFFVKDLTPHADTDVLVWDADGVCATTLIEASTGGGLDAAGVRAAIGLASANLDTQLDALPTAIEIRQEMDANSTKLDATVSSRLATASYTAPNNAGITTIIGYLDTEIAAILAAVDTEVGAIKTKTDGLPVDTNATLTAISGLVDDLESRLTLVRAGLLDNLTNLDAAVTTRLASASYVAPDNAGISTIVANTDTIEGRLPAALVGGRMDASVGGIAAGAITATSIAASALDGKGNWNVGKTGYSLTQAFPANFANLAITAGGLVDIVQSGADKVWGAAVRLLTGGTNITLAKGVGITGFNDIAATDIVTGGPITTSGGAVSASGVASASAIATAVRSELGVELARIDAAISSRLATAGYSAAPNAGTIADAVRLELAVELGLIDASIASRLASASYTAPASASAIASSILGTTVP